MFESYCCVEEKTIPYSILSQDNELLVHFLLITYQLKMGYPRYARCLDQGLMQEIKKTLVLTQTGKAEAQLFILHNIK